MEFCSLQARKWSLSCCIWLSVYKEIMYLRSISRVEKWSANSSSPSSWSERLVEDLRDSSIYKKNKSYAFRQILLFVQTWVLSFCYRSGDLQHLSVWTRCSTMVLNFASRICSLASLNHAEPKTPTALPVIYTSKRISVHKNLTINVPFQSKFSYFPAHSCFTKCYVSNFCTDDLTWNG